VVNQAQVSLAALRQAPGKRAASPRPILRMLRK
jgi:hypothetical protein